MYSGTRSWSELLEAGGVPTLPGGPSEAALRRGLGRLLHTDEALRIDQFRAFALAPVAPVIAELEVKTRLPFHMRAPLFAATVLNGEAQPDDAAAVLWANAPALAEPRTIQAIPSNHTHKLT